ncbi:phosphatidylinositol-binding protein scs2 [Vanrija albida]|uniref:Phosphatidylinositol-binding protein scs2 n=1 Tax=Vanrija albida TaxID=181172 RepID=A0ABR3Q5H9_9TREE
MSVILSPPNQLGFPRPLTVVVKRSLFIHNPHSSPVAFKVKTTAPKQYCVRPNQGRVEPGENVEVQIVLQPLPADPPPHAKCKDKFLVQSAFISPDEEMHSLPELWLTVEKGNKAAISEQKIRCIYLPAEDGSHPNGIPEENEDNTLDHSRLDESAIYQAAQDTGANSPVSKSANGALPSSRNSSGFAGAAAAGAGAVAAGGAAAYAATHDRAPANGANGANGNYNSGANGSSAAAPAPAVNRASVPSTGNFNPANLPSLSADDVQRAGAPTNAALTASLNATTSDAEKLKIALAENERLRNSAQAGGDAPAATGLRRRGVAIDGNAPASTKLATQQAPPAAGVPVEVVAGLIFAVFVLTYLFF